jgi:hypothetical protein
LCCCSFRSSRHVAAEALSQNRLDPGDVLSNFAGLIRPRGLSGGRLHPQIELLTPKLEELVLKLAIRHASEILDLHYATRLETKLVAIGSFAAARLKACLAVSSFTPDIS